VNLPSCKVFQQRQRVFLDRIRLLTQREDSAHGQGVLDHLLSRGFRSL
jgi:hypothetical protein